MTGTGHTLAERLRIPFKKGAQREPRRARGQSQVACGSPIILRSTKAPLFLQRVRTHTGKNTANAWLGTCQVVCPRVAAAPSSSFAEVFAAAPVQAADASQRAQGSCWQARPEPRIPPATRREPLLRPNQGHPDWFSP